MNGKLSFPAENVRHAILNNSKRQGFIFILNDVLVREFMSVWLCACEYRCPTRSKEGIRSFGTGIKAAGRHPMWVMGAEVGSL